MKTIRTLAAALLAAFIAAPAIDGKGGGRPEMAQAKGANRAGLAEALDAIRSAVRTRLEPPG